jgi:hypothetical protein
VRHFGKQKLDKKISSSHQAFHQAPCGYVQETTTWEQLELRKLELFDLVAQEQYRLQLARNLTKSGTTVGGESNKTEIEYRVLKSEK